jgi:hypothetical protein
MNLLSEIIRRLNQRIGVANIFDKQFGLCELNANGNDKAWIHYIGDGQGEVVTNFDAKQGTIFWAKRGKVNISIIDSLKVSGCKKMYQTTFPLTAYAVVRKSHLPCDSEDAQDWIASRVFKLTSGMDFGFKASIGVMSYEVIPNGYANEIKSLTQNYEWACVSIDIDVQIVSSADDGCYDTCETGEIPLPPNYEPCTPCLTEVAVDGVTITGNGTVADPLVAIGGGGGGGVVTAIAFSTDHLTVTGNGYVIGNTVWYNGNIYRCIANNDSILPTNATYWTNLGAGLQTIERPTDWDATSGNNQILNKPSIPAAQVNSDWNAVSGVEEILNKPTITAPVNADWNSVAGLSEILNKPSIPAAQIQSDWTQANNAALDFIKNKPTIPAGGLPAGGTAGQILTKVDATDYNAAWQENYADWTSVVKHIVKNNGASGTITKGTAVYVTGSNGTNMLVGRASNASEPTSSKTMGLMQSDITTTGSTQTGFVVTEGLLGNLNTAGTTAGDPVWLGVNGALIYGLINKPYAPAHLVFIGIVTKVSAGNGEIFVKVQNGFELKEIHDVDIITVTPVNGHLLGFDGTLWVNKTIAGWLGFTPVTNARTITINGTAQDLSADRSWTIPSISIFKDTTTGTASVSNTNTVSKTQLIPAGTFGNDIIQLDWGTVNKTGAGGAVVYRVYVNGTADLVGSPQLVATYTASNQTSGARLERRLNIKSATVTEIPTATSLLATDIGLNPLTNYNINWAVDKYFVFCVQNTSGADSTAVSYYRIMKT